MRELPVLQPQSFLVFCGWCCGKLRRNTQSLECLFLIIASLKYTWVRVLKCTFFCSLYKKQRLSCALESAFHSTARVPYSTAPRFVCFFPRPQKIKHRGGMRCKCQYAKLEAIAYFLYGGVFRTGSYSFCGGKKGWVRSVHRSLAVGYHMCLSGEPGGAVPSLSQPSYDELVDHLEWNRPQCFPSFSWPLQLRARTPKVLLLLSCGWLRSVGDCSLPRDHVNVFQCLFCQRSQLL